MTQPADRRRILALMAAAPLGVAGAASAARAADAPAAPAGLSEEERRRLTDFPWLARYADDNARVLAAGKPVTLVFMGDSITQGWPDKRPAFFAQGGRVVERGQDHRNHPALRPGPTPRVKGSCFVPVHHLNSPHVRSQTPAARAGR